MKNKDKIFRGLTSIVMTLFCVVALSACSLFVIPESERLKRIEPLVEQIDPSSLGEIVEETWRPGDGFAGGSSYNVKIKGDDAFNLLAKKLEKIPSLNCEIHVDIQISCNDNTITVGVGVDKKANTIHLQIRDSFGGRDDNE